MGPQIAVAKGSPSPDSDECRGARSDIALSRMHKIRPGSVQVIAVANDTRIDASVRKLGGPTLDYNPQRGETLLTMNHYGSGCHDLTARRLSVRTAHDDG